MKDNEFSREFLAAPFGMVIVPEDTYVWNPKEDITTYELALCIPIFVSVLGPAYCSPRSVVKEIKDLPDNARRHFDKVQGS